MNKDATIQYMVAFKGAIDLVANGVAEPETEDIAAEIASLADALNSQLDERTGSSAGGGGGKARRPSKKPAKTSRKGGFGGGGGGNYKFASDKQADFVVRLLDEKAHDIEYGEDSFVWDGDDVGFLEIPSNITQEVIEYLLAFDDA